jgi:predicted nucleotidyltransferase
VLLAKWRRDAFIARLEKLPDVIEVIPSGSLAHGTHIGTLKDIDLIVVFDKSAHPDYGSGSESAEAALTYLEGKLIELLHPLSGPDALIKGT